MELEIQCTVFTPDTAPEIKLNAIRSYGASVVKVDYVESLKTIHIANDYMFHLPARSINHIVRSTGTIY